MTAQEKIPTEYDDLIREKFDDVIAEYEPFEFDQTDRMIKFLCLVGRLKSLPRRGWLLDDRKIASPETIAGMNRFDKKKIKINFTTPI